MFKRALKLLLGCVLVFASWTLLLASATLLSGQGTPLFIIAPREGAARVAVNAGGALEKFTPHTAITRSKTPGFVRKLYANGAFLVLDANIVSGCRGLKIKEQQKVRLQTLIRR